jgi:hypothetical protein
LGQEQELKFSTQTYSDDGKTCAYGILSVPAYSGALNLCIVIDISGSTKTNKFGGTSVGDVNNDGSSDTVLDAEILATIKMLESLASSSGLTNDNVYIGLVTFSRHASFLGSYRLTWLNDPTRLNPTLRDKLLQLRAEDTTNFDDALDKAISCFQAAPVDRTNVMMFLSDGIPNVCGDGDQESSTYDCKAGDIIMSNSAEPYNGRQAAHVYTSELKKLDDLGVIRHAVGVGLGSDVGVDSGLDMIDNTPDHATNENAIQVTESDALVNLLTANPVVGNVEAFKIELNGVEDMNFNKFNLVSGPVGFSFGSYTLGGLNTDVGSTNVVKVTADMEFNGTKYSLSAQTTVTGGDVSGGCKVPGKAIIPAGGTAKAFGVCGGLGEPRQSFSDDVEAALWTCGGASAANHPCPTYECNGWQDWANDGSQDGKTLGRLWFGVSNATRTFRNIMEGTKEIQIEFDFLRLDGWDDSGSYEDKIWIVFQPKTSKEVRVPLGTYQNGQAKPDHSTTTPEGVKWTRTKYADELPSVCGGSDKDQFFHFQIEAPGELITGRELKVMLEVDMSGNDIEKESAAFDNFNAVFVHGHAPPPPQTFDEYADTGLWMCSGDDSKNKIDERPCEPMACPDCLGGSVLGRLWKYLNMATRTFKGISEGVEKIRVEFDFLRFDQWEKDDLIWLVFQPGTPQELEIPLGTYKEKTTEGDFTHEAGDVKWVRTALGPVRHIGSNSKYKDQDFHFVVTVPGSLVDSDGKIKVQFKVKFSDKNEEGESFAFDNFNIMMLYPQCDLFDTLVPTVNTKTKTSTL